VRPADRRRLGVVHRGLDVLLAGGVVVGLDAVDLVDRLDPVGVGAVDLHDGVPDGCGGEDEDGERARDEAPRPLLGHDLRRRTGAPALAATGSAGAGSAAARGAVAGLAVLGQGLSSMLVRGWAPCGNEAPFAGRV
jgi:hypothetical protein